MTANAQKRLALIGALAVVVMVILANAHLLSDAFRSQPACVAVEGVAVPAKRAC